MHRIILATILTSTAITAVAQERPTVGTVLDLEERILLKKMNEEMSRTDPNSAPKPTAAAKPKKIVYPTKALSVYGTSASFYEGQLAHGGMTHQVRVGTAIDGYIVTAVSPAGIELTKQAPKKKKGIGKGAGNTPKKIFAPFAQ